MSIVLFYLQKVDDPINPLEPWFVQFKDTELSNALGLAQAYRHDPSKCHVVISSELADSIGKAGVDSIKDGKTPDGHDYEWSKQHRGSGPVTKT